MSNSNRYVQNAPPCEKCGEGKFIAIPDSLACFCEKCGFVWISCGSGEFEKGASIQDWLKATYGKKEDKDA